MTLRYDTCLSSLVMLGVVTVIAGCQRSDEAARSATLEPVAAISENAAVQNGVTSATSDDKVSVKIVDLKGFESQVKQLSGKLVVVDVWSTSCPPCMREYPNLVALSQRWPEKVACVSLNVDFIGIKSKPVESYLPKVTDFLEKQKSLAVVNLMSSESDSEVFERLKIDSIPAVLIYDAAGNLVSTLGEGNSGDDGLTYAGDVVPAIEGMTSAN